MSGFVSIHRRVGLLERLLVARGVKVQRGDTDAGGRTSVAFTRMPEALTTSRSAAANSVA
jgi:hypothetical protein